MAEPEKVYIIGIGDDGIDGLTQRSRQLIEQADILVGAPNVLAAIPATGAARVEYVGDLDRVVRTIADQPQRQIAVLASGDPLFHGTARYLCDQLGKERFEVVPHVSTMQLAFARVKESWDEAYLANLAVQPLNRVIEKTRSAEKVGLFTTEEHTPSGVARALLEEDIDYFTVYVCENLGSPDERVMQGELGDVTEQSFSPLNVMILVRKPNVPDRAAAMIGYRMFGNPDETFLQSKPKRGLLTPAEVRAVALAEMDLGPGSIVWDVGAGSGAVAIEAALLARNGQVFAIERDQEEYQLIRQNAERFGVANLVPTLGAAPEAWADLPDPDSIFVGGTGRAVAGIVEAAYRRLRPRGRLVANVGSIESVLAVRQVLRQQGEEPSVWMFNIARGMDQLETVRFEAMNPTFLIGIVKPA